MPVLRGRCLKCRLQRVDQLLAVRHPRGVGAEPGIGGEFGQPQAFGEPSELCIGAAGDREPPVLTG